MHPCLRNIKEMRLNRRRMCYPQPLHLGKGGERRPPQGPRVPPSGKRLKPQNPLPYPQRPTRWLLFLETAPDKGAKVLRKLNNFSFPSRIGLRRSGVLHRIMRTDIRLQLSTLTGSVVSLVVPLVMFLI